jgi:hypothetical protein
MATLAVQPVRAAFLARKIRFRTFRGTKYVRYDYAKPKCLRPSQREMIISIWQQTRPVIFTLIRVAVSGATRVCKLALSATRIRATR